MDLTENKILCAIVVVILASVLQTIINAKRNRRVRQLPLIGLAFVLMVVGSWYLLKNRALFLLIDEYLDVLQSSEIFYLNMILLGGYVLIRVVLVPIVTLICRNKTLLEYFSLGIYEYDERYEEWFLKKQWINFRKYFKAIVYSASAASGLFIGLTWHYGRESRVWALLIPCAAVAVINEIYNYINGQTKEEFEHEIMGDVSDSRKISHYYKMREVLESTFEEPLLSSHTGSEFVGTETAADLIKQMKESENTVDRITADYFDANDRYKTADVDCVHATIQMMNRRNVIFFNPFYRDLSMYITLPLMSALMEGEKCLVLCGRKSSAEDIKAWLNELLQEYTHMRALWRVDFLSEKENDCEIGLLTFNQIYDKRVISTNRDFLSQVSFAILIEPSLMLNTSQVALSILADEMQRNGEKPVYCVCDRITDGMVDTLSHLLRSEITDVVAMPVPRCTYTAMSWNADGDFARQNLFDKQTRYLGNGVELAAVAIKNQIPKVAWYGETKAPVKDIKWIAGQHYPAICKYMNLPTQQKKIYEKIDFISNLWGSKVSKEEFVIVEDEFCNMFSMLRAYLSRGKNQAFVNVLSENYLLRDYMRCNRQMFMANPNSIPSYVPDYAKTERNTILKLILMMSLHPVTEDEVYRELHLIGIDTDDAYKAMGELVSKYTFCDCSIFDVHSVRVAVDEFTTMTSSLYSISEPVFEKYFSDSLKNAYFILEEEKDEEGYIDSRLFSHVTQLVLPGQFVTYDGKYYIVKYVSPQSGVVLRRASELFASRKYYRQVRDYHFLQEDDIEIKSVRKIGDIEFSEITASFEVRTSGYLEMNDSHNLRTAKLIDLSEDPTISNYVRKYRNKSILRIKLPESTVNTRFTICMLLSEMFKTIFPDAWQYLAIVSTRPDDIDGMLNYMVYSLDESIDDEYIYVIEDSDIDLGLLTAIEKHFIKFMEILTDFLEWHTDKMREPAAKDPVPMKVSEAKAVERKKRNLVVRMLDRIRNLFGGKKEEEVKVESIEKVEKEAEKESKKPIKEAENNETNTSEPTDNKVKQESSKVEAANVSEETTEAPVAETSDQATEDESDKNADVADKTEAEASEDATEASIEDVADDLRDEDADTVEEEKGVAPADADSGEDYSLDEEEKSEQKVKSEAEGTAQILVDIPEYQEYEEDEFEPKDTSDPDFVHIDGTDIFDNDGMPEDNEYLELTFKEMGLIPLTKSKYQEECFLKFGFEEIDNRIQVDEVRKYLRVRGWSNNSLTLARKRDAIMKSHLDINAVNTCDFCGIPLTGVSYECLNDGRTRCNDCSSSAITNVDDFRELFYRSMELMESIYSISYNVPISVKMTDARTVAKGAGCIFKPSTAVAPRVLGYAQRRFKKYSLVVENGSPRLAMTDTVVHEMTHIWQYLHWDAHEMKRLYRMRHRDCSELANDIVYEGMAMWAAIQYLYQIGETYYATQQEALAEARPDAYGIGFRLYREQYPLMKDSALLKYSPFLTFPPIEPDEVKNAIRRNCTKEDCRCK